MPGRIAGCLLTDISADFVLWGNFCECVGRDKPASLVAEQELQLSLFAPLHLLLLLLSRFSSIGLCVTP